MASGIDIYRAIRDVLRYRALSRRGRISLPPTDRMIAVPVTILCATLALALVTPDPPAGAAPEAQSPSQSPTPEPTSSPTATPTLGTIQGRMYVDVNGNHLFDAPDVPLQMLISIQGPAGQTSLPAQDGTYRTSGLLEGTYELRVFVSAPAGCFGGPVYTWAGDPAREAGCFTQPRFEANPQTAQVVAGQTAETDFIGVPLRNLSGWVWSNAAAVSPASQVAVMVGTEPCWTARVDHPSSAAGISVSFYSADLDSFQNPNCYQGDVRVAVDGRPSTRSVPWDRFWASRMNVEHVTGVFNQFEEVMVPPFMALAGTVSLTPQSSSEAVSFPADPVPDGTIVRAFIGNTQCGQATTKTLHAGSGPVANLFGIAVPPASVKPGCGEAGSVVAFCVGNRLALSVLVGTWSFTIVGELRAVAWEAGYIGRVNLSPTSGPCPVGPAGLPGTGGRL